MKKILRHPFRDQAALFLFSHAGPIKSNFEKIEPLDSSQRYKRYNWLPGSPISTNYPCPPGDHSSAKICSDFSA